MILIIADKNQLSAFENMHNFFDNIVNQNRKDKVSAQEQCIFNI